MLIPLSEEAERKGYWKSAAANKVSAALIRQTPLVSRARVQ